MLGVEGGLDKLELDLSIDGHSREWSGKRIRVSPFEYMYSLVAVLCFSYLVT